MIAAGKKRAERLEQLRQMVRIRAFEEKVKSLYARKLIRGSIHLYIGEEAVAVGACAALEERDWIVSTHRGHGHCIAKGGDARLMFAELLGKACGYCGGKGGSMHIAHISRGILGASGIVASGIPVATGAALSSKTLKLGRVVLSFFGDGANNNGAFHECLNIAALWKLPVVFICENNRYGITVSVEKSTAIADVALRAGSYGIPGVIVDGSDVAAVQEASRDAVARARSGDGPSLIECKTYRYEGHWVGDPLVYRTREEETDWREHRDCIDLLSKSLMKGGALDGKGLASLVQSVQQEIDEAAQWAEAQPASDPTSASQDVYSA